MFWFIRKRRPEFEVNSYALTGWNERNTSDTPVMGPLHVSSALSLESIPERVAVARVVRMFRDEVPLVDWEKVKDEVQYFVDIGFISFKPPEVIGASSLEEVVQKSRPAFKPESGPEYVNFYAQWLYCWPTAINASPSRAADLTRAGWRQAISRPLAI